MEKLEKRPCAGTGLIKSGQTLCNLMTMVVLVQVAIQTSCQWRLTASKGRMVSLEKGKLTKVNRRAKQREKAKRKERINLPLTKVANLEKERCRTRARVKVAKLRRAVLFVVKWATTQRIAGKL